MPLMLLKHWKLFAALALLASAFGGGVWVTHNHYKAQLAGAYEQANAELVEAIRLERRRGVERAEQERIRALTLSNQLAALRASHNALQEDIANAELAESRTVAQVDEEGVYSCPAPLGSDDFVRLWNEAADIANRRADP